ncbi:hypothetical protein [Flavobacterium johnsoniae]|uniref:Uncharacterized protein n=1 Tax=Flavobacterium johnsoniae TaxID=986 RepID=A0A1J7CUZ9_FLAJO|nr:hypothetical protein [Flavobacterium johnsoniae]OIV43442.1 hypothetical protein BKM63_04350 [Flavobacterium johnsoniae]
MSTNKKIILRVYLILSFLFVLTGFLYYFKQISLRGYYSDVFLFWLWLFMSFVVIVVFWKKITAKLLLAALLLTLAFSIIPMMIPFYALLLSTTSLGLIKDKNLNEKYRAQIVGYGVMTSPWLEVIEKNGLIEKRIIKCTDSQLMDENPDIKIRTAKDILFNKETDSTITLTLFYGGPNKTFTFNKKTGDIAAQTPDLKNLVKKYDGTWFNESEKSFLTFYFEQGSDYAVVNTWTGSIDKKENIDAYKAFIKERKLILPAENSDHHAPYCEIDIENNLLVYKCNQGLNFSDNSLTTKKPIAITKYKRIAD